MNRELIKLKWNITMAKTLAFITNLIFIALIPFSALAEKEELSSTQIKQYKNGIFEVVTLKLEDNVVYKEDFPHDLIPFHIRNDKQHSLGTSFLIKDKRSGSMVSPNIFSRKGFSMAGSF